MDGKVAQGEFGNTPVQVLEVAVYQFRLDPDQLCSLFPSLYIKTPERGRNRPEGGKEGGKFQRRNKRGRQDVYDNRNLQEDQESRACEGTAQEETRNYRT